MKWLLKEGVFIFDTAKHETFSDGDFTVHQTGCFQPWRKPGRMVTWPVHYTAAEVQRFLDMTDAEREELLKDKLNLLAFRYVQRLCEPPLKLGVVELVKLKGGPKTSAMEPVLNNISLVHLFSGRVMRSKAFTINWPAPDGLHHYIVEGLDENGTLTANHFGPVTRSDP
jgi:hypothetical protein